ncbi:hypothetical protein AVEN_6521-1 [Araneus ventricosus]|uniref:Uncharacterized protein n=1 Tax=Araneus ventricosus TaxID=182803 RepID=A0A4Y2WUJ4_ARAVE|nr:hypothetical protein AVEN_160769-1 [Araneus ventricosus]GBO40861.1 hypothetical protein AVEN_6521-1 [Araneus ventricosus]
MGWFSMFYLAPVMEEGPSVVGTGRSFEREFFRQPHKQYFISKDPAGLEGSEDFGSHCCAVLMNDLLLEEVCVAFVP